MPNHRTFIDASVLIAAAISPRGSARELIVAGLQGFIDVSVSSFVLMEAERNLARKAPRALDSFQDFIEHAAFIRAEPPVDLVRRVATNVEIKDAPVVAAAIVAEADSLATYDRKHLLVHASEIHERFGTEVLTPDVILDKHVPRRLREGGASGENG